uniref:Uncharacterized protein n=1 Tax=Arundo donax TaxID=35708 RepID=A0A0A9CI39_ARUDO
MAIFLARRVCSRCPIYCLPDPYRATPLRWHTGTSVPLGLVSGRCVTGLLRSPVGSPVAGPDIQAWTSLRPVLHGLPAQREEDARERTSESHTSQS